MVIPNDGSLLCSLYCIESLLVFRGWKNSVQIQAYYLNEVDCKMFQNECTFPYGMEEITFSWMKQCRKCIFILLQLLLFHIFTLKSKWKARCRNKVSFWLSLQKFWMNEWNTETQNNEMHTNSKENHRNCNERWNRVARRFFFDKMVFRTDYCTTINSSSHIQ